MQLGTSKIFSKNMGFFFLMVIELRTLTQLRPFTVWAAAERPRRRFVAGGMLAPAATPRRLLCCCTWMALVFPVSVRAQLCQTFATLWTVARQSSSVHGIFQASIPEWAAPYLPYSFPKRVSSESGNPTPLALLLCLFIFVSF